MVVLQKLLDLTSVTLRLRRTLLDLQQYDLSGKVTQTENYSSHMLSSCSIMPLTSGLHGTGRWMAYEPLFLDGRISTPYTLKTDIWSFGMTILVSLTIISFLFLTNNTFPNTKELLTLKVLYAHLTDTLVTIAIYKKELPPRPEAYNSEWSEERKRLWAICESCWNLDSGERPDIQAIIHELDGI